ncbi:hypothetical protein AN639_09160 [Candidatus Epulonipiscium fishelsonii]|uniref:Uncharacterized protein n=1 Tax=Candidatus Epulonipiscium fishelsonii TaxID=77094 RepID=A0ACC8XDW6_9FIRM|nr:hypothetical protein AN639_09160 [Epulopiscium sp. SCG-B05WGA-EpuloA1]ONI41015.1 hypothetical protein AN396_04445 [Epulopiscium sp. SCG-B11WGA-EpuloA1]
MMLIRVLTGIIGAPIAVAIIYKGGLLLYIIGGILVLIGAYEYYKVVGVVYNPIKSVAMLSIVVYLLGLNYFENRYISFISIFLVILLIIKVLTYPKYTLADIGVTLTGVIYIGEIFSLVLLIRNMPNGFFWVCLIFVSAWGSDTSAYFAGRALGKHKLAPVLSPKKTLEGAIGGVIGAGIMDAIFCGVMHYLGYWTFSLGWTVLIGCICAVLSQLGDLAASSIKREMGIKDFGSLFPGHGGVLDRFDSILLIVPFVYTIVSAL